MGWGAIRSVGPVRCCGPYRIKFGRIDPQKSLMALFRCATFLALVLNLPVALNLARDARAVPIVWSGPTITFTKSGADPTDMTDPLNQDRLTGNVWLTRGEDAGMFNVAPGHEDSYIRFTSPDDTAWATSVVAANSGKTIAASNWQQLSFTDWAASYGGPGSALLGNITTHNAVVHLLTDDIYLDLNFTAFDSSGNFTYDRSTAAMAAPTGDYNGNHIVDAGDYVVWQKTFNNSASPAGSGADGDSSGTIGPGDYTYWRARFGNAAPGSGSLAGGLVPEPATISLQLGWLLALTWRVRKKTGSSRRTK
jgi:hypothetical protein